MKDGDETGVDCGGSCSPCAAGGGCFTGSDCADKVCSAGTCLPPSCTDHVKNGTETDVDCGGSCSPCGATQDCGKNADCTSMNCSGGTCQPTCTDGAKDGAETDVDCGGPVCTPCKDTLGCALDRDCQSGICQMAKCAPIEVWSKGFGDTSAMMNAEAPAAVAVDGAGNVFLAALTAGSVDFGGGPLANPGTVLVKFDASGKYVWNQGYTSTNGGPHIVAISADSAGNAYVTGLFSGQAYLGTGAGCNLTAPPSTQPIFVAKISPFGDGLWCKAFGTAGLEVGETVAVDTSGNVIVAGYLGGTADFGGTSLTNMSTLGNGTGDLFAVELDPSGNYVWAKDFGSVGDFSLTAVYAAVDGSGNVLLTGTSGGSLNFGGSDLLATAGSGFAAKLTTMGAHLWSKQFNGTTDGVSIDATGNVVLAGAFGGMIDFGGGPLTSSGTLDIFLAKLDPSGAQVWAKHFAASTPPNGPQVAGLGVDGAGQPVLVGNFVGTINLGGAPLVCEGGAMGGDDLFVAKFDTSGGPLWSRRFGDVKPQDAVSVVIDGTGEAVLAGTFEGSFDFGGAPLTNTTNSTDIFLAKLRTP